MHPEPKRLIDLARLYYPARRLAGKDPRLTRRAIAKLAKGLGREPTTDDLDWRTLRRATEALHGTREQWKTTIGYMRHLRAFWKFLHEHGHVARRPCRLWIASGPSGGFLQLASVAPLPRVIERSARDAARRPEAVEIPEPRPFDGAGLNAQQPEAEVRKPKPGRTKRLNRWIVK